MFLTAAVTKFTAGPWVTVLAVGLCVLVALRVRRRYELFGEAIALRPH